jgi:hypothetical protein
LKIWCKNSSPAGPLNKPPFCIPSKCPLSTSILEGPPFPPPNVGPTIFFCFLLSPHPLSSRNPTGASPPAAAARTAAHLAFRLPRGASTASSGKGKPQRSRSDVATPPTPRPPPQSHGRRDLEDDPLPGLLPDRLLLFLLIRRSPTTTSTTTASFSC